MSVELRPENNGDRAAIWHVNQEAFGGDSEVKLVDALRDGGFAEVSLVAELDGEIVGHILFSRVTIITNVGTVNALSLAPRWRSCRVISDVGSAAGSWKWDFKRVEKAATRLSWCLATLTSTHDSGSRRNWLVRWNHRSAAVRHGWLWSLCPVR